MLSGNVSGDARRLDYSSTFNQQPSFYSQILAATRRAKQEMPVASKDGDLQLGGSGAELSRYTSNRGLMSNEMGDNGPKYTLAGPPTPSYSF